MADLDPLKFKVAIQDEATKELERIEKEFTRLKDKTITVKVEGLDDLQRLLSALQHTQVQNIGKEVSAGIKSATEGLQESAQKAIRESLGQLAADLTAVKTAIQHDNFTAFSQRIEKCAEAVNTLDAAFKQFHVTIGQDGGLKNFMTGLGEVVRNVRTTMGQLNGFGQERASGINVYERNVQRMEDALYRLSEARQKVISSISMGKEAGMDVSAWEKYLQILNAYTKKLQEIRSDPEMMNGKGWQADAFGSVFKHLVGNASDAERQVSVFVRQIERLKEAREKAMGMTTESAAQGQVKLLGINSKDTTDVEKRIDYLTDRLKELGKAINETMALQSKHPNEGTLKGIQGMISEYDALKRELDALYVSYQKVSSLTDSIDGKSLGLGHIKGYTGPMTALDENQWLALKRQAEIQEVAGEAAQRHQRKLEELTNAFAQHDAQVAKSQRVQDGDNRARRESAEALRKQAQELVNLRLEALRSQEQGLTRLLSNGKEGLGSDKYNAIRDALRDVREEARQLEAVMQRMESYSTRDLFAVGRGRGTDYAPLISNTERYVAAKKQVTEEERLFAAALKQATSAGKSHVDVLRDLKSLATQYLGVWGGQQFLNNIIKIGGQLESQRLSLTAILGEASYANELYSKVQGLALKSPFGVVELDQYTKNLSAYGFQFHELFDMTKRLADISAGTGTDFGRLALALGHVRSEMALTGYTLRQFSMANVPMLKMLAENLGVTTSEIRKMVRAKEISYQDVENVIKELTNEGGMFYNMQETMSEAVSAKFKNLKDSMDIMYGQMAESGIGDLLKSIAVGLMQVTTHWQSTAAAIGIAASMMAIYKLAQMAVNKGIEVSTTGLLSNSAATKLLTAEKVKELAIKELITKQDLVQAVATGRLTYEQASLAAATLGVDAAFLKELGLMNGLQKGLKGLEATLRATLANPWTVALIGISAVTAAITEYRSWSKGLEDDAKAYIERQKSGVKEIADYLSTAKKPTNERELVGVNEEMRSILKNAGLYTDELENQIGNTKTLSDEYDVLIGKMEAMNDVLTRAGVTYKDIASTIKATGVNQDVQDWINVIGGVLGIGVNLFTSDDLNQNAQDLSSAQMEARKSISKIGKDNLQQAVDSLLNAGVHTEMANYPLEEQLRILSEDRKAWRLFAKEANDGSDAFRENAKELRRSLKDVSKQWKEVAEGDIPAIVKKMRKDLGDGMSNNSLVSAYIDAVTNGISDPKLAETLRKNLLAAVNGDFESQLAERLETAVEKAARLEREAQNRRSDALRKIGVGGRDAFKALNPKDNSITPEWINKYIDLSKEPEDIENAVIQAIKKQKSKVSSGKKLKLITTEDEAELNRLNLLKDFFGFSDKSNSRGDANAKKLREKVRILKEAEESYQYWRKQVGGEGAVSHVNEEFGKLLEEQGFSFDNIEAYRTTLQELRAEYEKKPQSKEMLEALKELDKVLADIGRKDFEKLSEEAMSGMKKQLDDLTRAWEIYNSVLESSGDAALATRVSGVSYGATAADLKRTALSDYAGVGIDFDTVLGMSEEEIERYVEGLGLDEEKIKAVQDGLKEWKKAQQEVEKSDIVSYAQWLGTLVDYESQRVRLQNEYNDALELTNRLLKAEIITEEEAQRLRFSADVKRETEGKEMEAWYNNLYGNSQAMARTEFADVYALEMDNLDRQLAAGNITLTQYAEKVENLNKIAQEFSTSGFLGVRGGVGAYLSGGVQGLIGYYQARANKSIADNGGVTAESKKWQDLADRLAKTTKGAEQVAEAFSSIAEKANMLGDMFDALGMEDSANAFRDAGSVLGGIASGASSLSALGVWGMAAGAVIGGVTAVAKVHDERLERQIAQLDKDVQSIESNTELIKLFRSRQLGYDNGAMKWRMAASTYKSGGALAGGYERFSKAQRAMYAYYGQNSVSTGYAQEYANLIAERQKEIEGLDKLLSQKKQDTSAIEEAKKKIAELDEQILYFGEDLAKELWGIDLKSWADQIGDALMNAFENGENAAKAYEDTVRSIMQSVTSEVLKVGILEPMMESLREKLFGKLDKNGKRTGGVVSDDMMANNPAEAAKLMVTTVGEFFKPGGDGSNMVTAAQEFYAGINDLMAQMGYSNGLMNPDTSSTLSASLRGTSEETSGLLAGYVNALRQDVAADRLLLTQFVSQLWPEYIESFARSATAVANIDNNVRAIMEMMESGRGRMYEEIAAVRTRIDRVASGFDSFHVK